MTKWLAIGPGRLGIDWSGPPSNDRSPLWRCDPYLVWFDTTSAGAQVDGPFQPLVDAADAGDDICVLIEKNLATDKLPRGVVPNHTHGSGLTRFVTASMARGDAWQSLRDLINAVRMETVQRFTLQTAPKINVRDDEELREFDAKVSASLTATPAESLLLYHYRIPGLDNFFEDRSRPPDKVFIGIIDHGCPILNDAFWNGATPRLAAVLQQDRLQAPQRQRGVTLPDSAPDNADELWVSPTPPETIEQAVSRQLNKRPQVVFRIGRRLDLLELRRRRERDGNHTVQRELDRQPRPRHTRDGISIETVDRPSLRTSHGCHVMSLAAAEPSPLQTYGSPASTLPPPQVAFVQLPEGVVDDTSGRALAANALDGIHFLLNVAQGHPLIVNLSYGTYAGPHDGTSMFERALLELFELDDKAGKTLSVVLPAGNSHRHRGHVRERLTPSTGLRARRTMYWKIPPDDPTDSYLEIWLPRGAKAAIHIRPPHGGPALKLVRGEARHLVEADVLQGAAIFPEEVAQSSDGTMVLIAVGRTRNEGNFEVPVNKETGRQSKYRSALPVYRKPLLASHGVWEIDIENIGSSDFDVHAWIERDDAAPDARPSRQRSAGRQSYFIDVEESCVAPESTLNGIATAKHPRMHVVGAAQRGATMHRTQAPPVCATLSDYSSAGPNRDSGDRFDGPDVVTIADDSRSMPGLLAGGMASASKARMNGTSVAAAVYTRLLARHIAEGRDPETEVGPYEQGGEGHEAPIWPTDPREAAPLLRGLFKRLQP